MDANDSTPCHIPLRVYTLEFGRLLFNPKKHAFYLRDFL
jgi:hypothetical protein